MLISPETQRLRRTIIYAHGLAGLSSADVGTAGWRALLWRLVAVGALLVHVNLQVCRLV